MSANVPASLTLDLGARYLVKDIGIAWYLGDERVVTFQIEGSDNGSSFFPLGGVRQSVGDTRSFERNPVPPTGARYIRITGTGASEGQAIAIVEAAVFGCRAGAQAVSTVPYDTAAFGLDPTVAPGRNFDLQSWALDTPEVDPADGFSRRIIGDELNDFSDQYFFTAPDGGMVFRTTIAGAKSSANTSFTRTELREMLRRGDTSIRTQGVNENNWILGYQPDPGVPTGGRGGTLKGTLAVNQTTTTGSQSQVGRFVIGQIHASSDEPIRLYYRKFPQNARGMIYFAHEIRDGSDIFFSVVGPQLANRKTHPQIDVDPYNGIALDEVFSYEITNSGSRIDVIIRRGDQNGPIIGHNYVDMAVENSGYDRIDEWNYFKAGVYTQNNSGMPTDFDQVTFYSLFNSHD
ncbi:poly(beta-D-mannuronate) lyase [Croceicoccus naphthovorans]|nr:poly(beta-D-mannuronate) lyase [Croceicoccus naphthovorans]